MCRNTTNDTLETYRYLEGLGYSLVFVLGLLICGAALWAFIAKRASWTDSHIYMLNLVLADFALVLFLPFRVYDAFFCLPITFFCTFLIFIHFINMYASILTMTAISVHRYLSIRFPLQARSWRRRKEAAVAVCLLIWLFLVSVVVAFREDYYPKNLWACYERHKAHRRLHPQLGVLVLSLGYLAPLLIIVFCSSGIICIMVKEQNQSEERKSIVGIVKANMIVFLICYTPFHIAILDSFFSSCDSVHLPSHVFLQVSEWIASTNCCFDAISYYFLLKRFYTQDSDSTKNTVTTACTVD
ncbi:G-protein coupled receptor 35-like [Fundulus heteroclitus]|uniref:G-protein coupled receptor 35-like n=1 Tax=Fundulus heteroclitus TaxID=8078 RepID=UPI00165A709F|nr:G-protein coupled receptor 35-like [Fundulus heteroclitus]